jgi:mono/diheme cytochrome c family protein
MMAGWDGRISDRDIWSIVHYIRALAAKGKMAVAPTPAEPVEPATPRRTLELVD